MDSCEHFIFQIVLSEEHFNLFTKKNIFFAGEQFKMFSFENIRKSKTKNDLENWIFLREQFSIVPILIHLEMFTKIFCRSFTEQTENCSNHGTFGNVHKHFLRIIYFIRKLNIKEAEISDSIVIGEYHITVWRSIVSWALSKYNAMDRIEPY